MSYTVGNPRLPKRFWDKIRLNEKGCWEWTASCTKKGYGQFHVGSKKNKTNKMVSAHRYAYEHLVGPIPDGLQTDHLCRNHPCVNPDHLEPVTNSVNARRGLTGINGVLREGSKKHCPQGHPYDEENTGRKANGWRYCRTCARERMRLKEGYPKPPNYPNIRKTHCPKGHPYDETNTYIKPNGRRVCITCRNLLKRLARQRS